LTTALTDTPAVVHVMEHLAFEALQRESPDLALRFYMALGQVLAARFRSNERLRIVLREFGH
jgi:hypothetical protein